MASINGIECDFVSGGVGPFFERVEEEERAGVAGKTAMLKGLGAAEFQFAVVKYGEYETCSAWLESIAELVGTVVTIVDDRGKSWQGCVINDIRSSMSEQATGAPIFHDRRVFPKDPSFDTWTEIMIVGSRIPNFPES